ncbi:MAG: hypothetical protein DA408_17465 [Bacteroidetes bacterium]|nr:MAG: hypothetical protein C7N36_08200 [Bacteroidota bacterium]PTM09844.1 MAG: hypothetical protein DA408_17465 [Bacteroidota bacterium]
MQFYQLEAALAHPTTVQHLVLRGQNLRKVPASIWLKFPHLISLDLRDNQLRELPPELALLTGLERLYLSHNRLISLAAPLRWPQLRHLDASHNRLREVQLSGMAHLETLDLSHNKLTQLPTGISTAQRLLHLHLAENKLPDLPDLQAGFPQLQYLNVAGCGLSQLPALPPLLYALVANRNRLQQGPPNWRQLTVLQRLELAVNPLGVELSELASCSQLRYLDVRRTPTRWPSPTALVAQLPLLQHVFGGFPKRSGVHLQDFLTATSKNPDPASRVAWWALWRGERPADLAPVHQDLLWASLTHDRPPLLRLGAHRELVRRFPTRARQIPQEKWWIAGELATDEVQLREWLQAAHVALASSPAAATGILLGHHFPTAVVPPTTALPILAERDLLRWLDQRTGRYLTHSTDADQLANIRRLLQAADRGSFLVATQLLRAHGTPDAVLELLLKEWSATAAAIRADWADLLLPYLPADLQIALLADLPLADRPRRRGRERQWWTGW